METQPGKTAAIAPRSPSKLLILICLTFLLPYPLLSWSAGTDSPVKGIEALTAAINRLADQIEIQKNDTTEETAMRRLQMAIDYLNFRTRRIERLEGEIVATRDTRLRLESALAFHEEKMKEAQEKMTASPQSASLELLTSHNQLKSKADFYRQQLSRLDEDVIIMENRLLDLRSEITELEAYVQRNLKF